jgi:hypothetical protein
MTIRISTALRTYLIRDGGFKRAFQGGILELRSAAQPSTADVAVSGTPIVITLGSGAHTKEVRSTGTLTLTGGAAGSVDAITVNSIAVLDDVVPFTTDLTTTAALVAAKINEGISFPEYTATSSGAVITIMAGPGTGTSPNTFVIAPTTSTITTSVTAFAGGIASANGLKFANVASGVLSKGAYVWSGVNTIGSTFTPASFRLKGAITDANAADDVTQLYFRLDGSVGVSGSDITISSASIANGVTVTIDQFDIDIPAY